MINVIGSVLKGFVGAFYKEVSKARISDIFTSSGSLLKERKGFKEVVDMVKEDAKIVDF
jgi:hypothetical protein